MDNGTNLSGIERGARAGSGSCSVPEAHLRPASSRARTSRPASREVVLDGFEPQRGQAQRLRRRWAGGRTAGCTAATAFMSHVQARQAGHARRAKRVSTWTAGCGRYHPVARQAFEAVAHRHHQPLGAGLRRPTARCFITNCVIKHLWHVVPGRALRRACTASDANPFAYALMPSIADHLHWAGGDWTESRADKATGALKKEHGPKFGGGHAHSGAAILPERPLAQAEYQQHALHLQHPRRAAQPQRRPEARKPDRA